MLSKRQRKESLPINCYGKISYLRCQIYWFCRQPTTETRVAFQYLERQDLRAYMYLLQIQIDEYSVTYPCV